MWAERVEKGERIAHIRYRYFSTVVQDGLTEHFKSVVAEVVSDPPALSHAAYIVASPSPQSSPRYQPLILSS
jgi:hypothetical protein